MKKQENEEMKETNVVECYTLLSFNEKHLATLSNSIIFKNSIF